jgi:ribonuclease HI
LVDLTVDWIEPANNIKGLVPESPWLVYCDGAWGNAGAGASTILISPLGVKLRYVTRLHITKEIDKCTNNIVEYEVVILGFQKLRAMGCNIAS